MLLLVFLPELSLQLSALSGGHLRSSLGPALEGASGLSRIESLGPSTLYLAAVGAGGFSVLWTKVQATFILPPVRWEELLFSLYFLLGVSSHLGLERLPEKWQVVESSPKS